MKKYTGILFVLSLLIIPAFSFAQVGDVDPNPSSDCISITNNLRYRDRDVNKNGEVSTLQDFLQFKGYLNSEPTGYFGLLTLKAVKDFQNANGITPVSGYVGPITRAKIQTLTCGTTLTPTTDGGGGGSGPILPIGCTSTVGYSPITGVKCDTTVSTNLPEGCTSVFGYSPITGVKCNSTATFPPGCNSTQGFSSTTGLACDGSQITSFPPGCNSSKGYSSTTGQSCGSVASTSSITVLSPNGGETWVKGTIKAIKWQDNNTSTCPIGSICDPAPKLFNIYLVKYPQPSCAAPATCYVPPYIISNNISDYGSSHSSSWNVGQARTVGSTVPQTVPDGSYTIQVCFSGAETYQCDSSDSYFKITSSTTTIPVISSVSGPQSLNVNQIGTWKVNAYDSSDGNLSYSVNWGDTPATCSSGISCSISTTQSPQQSATFTHSYTNAGTYTPTFTVTNTSGQTAQTSLSVKVENIISINTKPILNPITVTGSISVDQSVNFNFNATDPDNDKLRWSISWGDGNFYSSGISGSCDSTNCFRYSTSKAWHNTGTYQVTVTVTDDRTNGTAETSFNVNVIGATVPTTPPATPTNFTATPAACGTGTINLSWNASSGATSYHITKDGTVIPINITATSFSDGVMTAGSSHTYSIAASNSAGTSASFTIPVTIKVPMACTSQEANVLSALNSASNNGQSTQINSNEDTSSSCGEFTMNLSKGMNNSQVKCLQKMLIEKGFKVEGVETGKETTYFGYNTLVALKAFQASNQLVVDGILGPVSSAALKK